MPARDGRLRTLRGEYLGRKEARGQRAGQREGAVVSAAMAASSASRASITSMAGASAASRTGPVAAFEVPMVWPGD